VLATAPAAAVNGQTVVCPTPATPGMNGRLELVFFGDAPGVVSDKQAVVSTVPIRVVWLKGQLHVHM
jgi:hypothetical protein